MLTYTLCSEYRTDNIWTNRWIYWIGLVLRSLERREESRTTEMVQECCAFAARYTKISWASDKKFLQYKTRICIPHTELTYRTIWSLPTKIQLWVISDFTELASFCSTHPVGHLSVLLLVCHERGPFHFLHLRLVRLGVAVWKYERRPTCLLFALVLSFPWPSKSLSKRISRRYWTVTSSFIIHFFFTFNFLEEPSTYNRLGTWPSSAFVTSTCFVEDGSILVHTWMSRSTWSFEY